MGVGVEGETQGRKRFKKLYGGVGGVGGGVVVVEVEQEE